MSSQMKDERPWRCKSHFGVGDLGEARPPYTGHAAVHSSATCCASCVDGLASSTELGRGMRELQLEAIRHFPGGY